MEVNKIRWYVLDDYRQKQISIHNFTKYRWLIQKSDETTTRDDPGFTATTVIEEKVETRNDADSCLI